MDYTYFLFRNDPPGQSASMATQDLLRLVEANPNGLPVLDPVRDLHVQDIDYVESHRRLKFLRDSFAKYRCIHDSNFKENVRINHIAFYYSLFNKVI